MTADDRSTHIPSAVTARDNSNTRYEIHVRGHLASHWSTWFDGLTVAHDEDGISVISGAVVDQAALHGLLSKLRDVGIPLVSLNELPTDAPTEPSALEPNEGN